MFLYINDLLFGFVVSVWLENMFKVLCYVEDIDVGMVWVNMYIFFDFVVFFGGMKGLGIGCEFGSVFIDDYIEFKFVMVCY